jgi:DNA-binding CsgD family transcriptional regulator
MADGDDATIEAWLLDGRTSAAAAAIGGLMAREHRAPAGRARFAAAAYALGGRDRALSALLDPQLLACRNFAEVEAYLARLDAPDERELLPAGEVLAWAGDAAGTYRLLRAAHERALSEKRIAFAVGALERCARHALLFGDVVTARIAIEDAAALAARNRLERWRLRCAAAAAAFALDAGEIDPARRLLDDARSAVHSADLLALFAPAGAALALFDQDAAALADWSSEGILGVALYCPAADAAVAATVACLLAAGIPPRPSTPVAGALRRALLQAENAAAAPELFSLAARYGDNGDARLAVAALGAVCAPDRRYLAAQRLLASAHWEFRFGERARAIDHASDAARAFDAIGLRRWTNDAMLLLVHHESAPEPRPRRRPTALSLTEREQQVSHLIRRGASNREVARALQISEHTVERHVSSILSRLGLRSRWQIVDARNADTQH